ncbi:MAG: hypothetical protein K2P84_11475 [Undibacterium sp.]|nr:hypothetical protein [Undibacterium sp.]
MKSNSFNWKEQHITPVISQTPITKTTNLNRILIVTCMAQQRIYTVSHVNVALQQPHWRSHEALIKQQVKAEK